MFPVWVRFKEETKPKLPNPSIWVSALGDFGVLESGEHCKRAILRSYKGHLKLIYYLAKLSLHVRPIYTLF